MMTASTHKDEFVFADLPDRRKDICRPMPLTRSYKVEKTENHWRLFQVEWGNGKGRVETFIACYSTEQLAESVARSMLEMSSED